ncbi:hypothetical protein P5V15_013731 [Pogonomyrmex californicus]
MNTNNSKKLFRSIYRSIKSLLIDNNFTVKESLETRKIQEPCVRCLEYNYKTVLINVGNLSSSLFLLIALSFPPPPVNSNFVKAKLGNGRCASSTVSFLLQYQFEPRAPRLTIVELMPIACKWRIVYNNWQRFV